MRAPFLVVVAAIASCAEQSGYDPARYAPSERAAAPDPDTEPVGRAHRSWMLDPRAAPRDAGVDSP